MKRTNLVLLVLSIILIAACDQIDSETEASPEWDGETRATMVSNVSDPLELEEVEIREYKGEKLGSVDDFRENSIKGPQYVDIDNYQLEIHGLVEEPKNYTYEEVLDRQKYSKVLTLYCVEGWNVRLLWEGILLKELFDEVKVTPEANTVIFYAYDGYSTSMPLDYILDNDILLAYKMNNITLPPERGFPFQLVAEDKLGYKWAKWITKIRLSDNPNYKGYWESRGYNNDADLRR
jgi:DMSO/TMAO reductase YedYZ molybdopterin-dependent catalytic subunit